MEPTGEARLLEQEIRQGASGLEHIKDSAIAIARVEHARLKIVTTPCFSNQLLPDLIGLFYKARPNSMARLEIKANDEAVNWMVPQNYNLLITESNNPNPSFERLKIKDENVSCLLPKGHQLADRPFIYARDLAGERFLSYDASLTFPFRNRPIF